VAVRYLFLEYEWEHSYRYEESVSVASTGYKDSREDTYEMDPVYSETATTFVGGWMATDQPSKVRSTVQSLVGSFFAFEGSLMKDNLAWPIVTRVSPESSGPEVPLNTSRTGIARSPSDHAAWYSFSCSRRLAIEG